MVRYNERVQVEHMPGRSFSEVMDRAKHRIWDNMKRKKLVVIHARVNDVHKMKGRHLGKQIETGVAKLRAVSEGVHIGLCTIPKVQGRGQKVADGVIRKMREAFR